MDENSTAASLRSRGGNKNGHMIANELRVEARMGLAEELVDTAPIVQDTSEVIQEEDQVCLKIFTW